MALPALRMKVSHAYPLMTPGKSHLLCLVPLLDISAPPRAQHSSVSESTGCSVNAG